MFLIAASETCEMVGAWTYTDGKVEHTDGKLEIIVAFHFRSLSLSFFVTSVFGKQRCIIISFHWSSNG